MINDGKGDEQKNERKGHKPWSRIQKMMLGNVVKIHEESEESKQEDEYIEQTNIKKN